MNVKDDKVTFEADLVVAKKAEVNLRETLIN